MGPTYPRRHIISILMFFGKNYIFSISIEMLMYISLNYCLIYNIYCYNNRMRTYYLVYELISMIKYYDMGH